jgi:NAD(P)-dependent dehydrogenase (short-subunit alcohol dehydrogenase family)
MHKIGTSERPDLALAVVVGAGGLGVAIARRMALSYRVLLVDVEGARVEAEAERLRGEGCDARAVACDITSAEAVADLAAGIEASGGFQAAVIVAGISPSGGNFRQIAAVNLHGAALVVEALRPIARPGSAMVMISSLAAHLFTPSAEAAEILKKPADPGMVEALERCLGPDGAIPTAAYGLSKWGMNLMARRQAPAWGERGARIVTLSPGLIATPMGAREFAASEAKRELYKKSPILRECTMLEIADGVEFLASPRASFISGTDLRIDGGLAAAVLDA